MTVAATTNRKTYTGDNVTTSFATSPVIFYLSSNLQVRVTVIATGVSTLLTENTHYTVTGGSAAGAVGTVNLAGGSSPHGALLSTEKLVILRVLPLTQAVDLVNNNNSDAEVLEAALDKLTDVDQQIQEQADRSIRFASGDVSGSVTEIPDVTTRAGRLLGFDATGLLTTIIVAAGTSLVDFASSTGASLIGFLQSGTGAVLRTLLSKLRDENHILDFGAVGDDSTDDNAHLQAFLNKGGRLILGGGKTYRNLAANLTFVANTELLIERGTTLHLDTTRLSAINVNDVQIHNHGVIKSTSLNTTDALPTNWNGRGIVEFGGTIASPALRVGIDGPGEVFGDFAGTPGTTVIVPTDKRRGILFNNVQTAWAKFNNVHGITAEAIWHNGTVGVDRDIDIAFNRIYDCNHDAISAQQTVTVTFRTRGNIGRNCLNGIEASVGEHRGNLMSDMIGAGYSFGGTSPADNGSPVIYASNTGINNGNSGAGSSDFSMQGATAAGGVAVIENNTSYSAGAHAFFVSYAKTAIITGNKSYGWGTTAVGSGMTSANCTNVIVDGNGLANENAAHSNGGYNIAATGQLLFGNSNTVFGVVTPYVNFSSVAQGLKPSPIPVYSRVGQSSHTGDTNPFTLGTYTVKAHACGLTGGVRVTAGGTLAGVANTKTLNLSYGGNNFAQLIIPAAATRWRLEAEFYNVGTTGNQAYSNTGLSGTAVISTDSGTLATDSTVDKDIVLSVTNQNAGDTLTQNIFMIEPIIGMTQ